MIAISDISRGPIVVPKAFTNVLLIVNNVNTCNKEMHQVLWLLCIVAVWYNSKLRSRMPCYDSGWFSALQFVLLAPEVLVDIKTTIFYNAFCSLILLL